MVFGETFLLIVQARIRKESSLQFLLPTVVLDVLSSFIVYIFTLPTSSLDAEPTSGKMIHLHIRNGQSVRCLADDR